MSNKRDPKKPSPHAAQSLAASVPNEIYGKVDNNPVENGTAGLAPEPDQVLDDIKNFLKYIVRREDERVRREDERARREEERARKEDERAEKLHKILVETLESSAGRTDKLQKAIVEAIKPPTSRDPKDKFWNAYRKVSQEHDDEFLERYSDDLDATLLFAGLFSTICVDFIMAAGDYEVVESLLYISFFATLLVTLLAVLSKQWLSYYARVGMRGTIRQRGIERQRKFEGFRRYGFEYVMTALPVLLQISLLLFEIAVVLYLWGFDTINRWIVLASSLLGIAAYVFFVLTDIFGTDSPFQMPLSKGLLRIPFFKSSARSLTTLFSDLQPLYRRFLDFRKPRLRDPERVPVQLPASEIEPLHKDNPLFGPQVVGNEDEYDCLAVLWMLELSTEPDIVTVAGSMAVELQWSLNIDFIPPLTRFRDTFMGCFEASPDLQLRESATNQAIACGQGYYHLYALRRSMRTPSTPWDREADFPEEFFSRMICGDSKEGPFESAELNFVYSCLKGDLSRIQYSSFSPSFFGWALHVSPYPFYLRPVDPQADLRDIPSFIRPSRLGVVDRSDFSNSLLYMGSAFGIPLDRRVLAVVNKSDYCENVLENLLRRLAECDQGFYFSQTVCEVLKTVVIYLREMDRPPNFSDIRYVKCIYTLCGALRKDAFRPIAAFSALRLISIFQKDRLDEYIVVHASEIPSGEPEEWVREVAEFLYDELDGFNADDKWDDQITQTVEDFLRGLIHVPQFGRYKPPHQFLRILSKSMSPSNDGREHLQRLAYYVIWLSRDYWFDDDDLRPVLQESNVLSQLGSLAESNRTHYGPSYMQMIGLLSGIPAWVPVIRYDIHRWINLYIWRSSYDDLEQTCVLALKRVLATDEAEPTEVQTENISALALMAMGKVWKNLDFSSRIAIESFCPLAKCTWLLMHPDPFGGSLSVKAAGRGVAAGLRNAIQHARNKVLEMKSQDPRTEMEQREIKAIQDIANELTEIKIHLLGNLVVDENEYDNIRERIDILHTSLRALLTHPRCCLGTL